MKKSFIKTILKVIGLFLVFELIIQLLGALLTKNIIMSIKYGKYGLYYISELVVLLLSIVIVVVRKKFYIFKEKRLSFKNTIFMSLPILIISGLLLISNTVTLIGKDLNFINWFSLILYVIFIGLFEEIFFRGIILQELLDDFYHTKKEVIFSILLSAIIFGSLHLTNILVGQDLLTTIMQVIQTTAIGILLGTIYYLSKNIWALAFIHGFYDYAVLLGSVNYIKDCEYVANVPFSITLSSLVASMILSIIYILYSRSLLNKSNFNKALGYYVSEEDKKSDVKLKTKINTALGILIMVWVLFNVFYSLFIGNNIDEYYKCYEYEEKTIKRYETHYYSYNDFSFIHNNMNYRLYKDNNNAYLENIDTKETVELKKKIDNISYIEGYFVLTNKEEVYYYDLSKLDSLNSFKGTYKTIIIPNITVSGYLLDSDNNTKYLLVKDRTQNKFIIEEDNLKMVK